MSQFTVSGRIIADAARLVTAAKEAKAALDGVAAAETNAAAGAEQLNAATERTVAAERSATAASGAAATAERAQAAAIDRTRAATEMKTRAEAAHGQALGFTRMQSLALRYTLSDVAASLASGASPTMILMQQGPQLAQVFDSPREAATKLLGLFTPMRLAIGGVAGAAVLGVAAYESYAASVRQVDVALIAHGDRLGLSRAAWQDLSSAIAGAALVSEREGRTIAAGMIAAGVASEQAMKTAAEAARGYAVATGQDAASAALELAEKLKTPGKSARELAEQFNLLDEATLRQIESAERSGDVLRAQGTLAAAIKDGFAAAADETSGWARAFGWLATQASDAWDAVGKFMFGGPSDPAAALAARKLELERQIAGLDGAGGQNPYARSRAAGAVQQARNELATVQAEIERLENEQAEKKRAREVAEHSRAIGLIDARYNAEEARLRQLADDEANVRRYLARTDLTADQRTDGQRTLGGIERARTEIFERRAAPGRAAAEAAARDAEREAERAAREAERRREEQDRLRLRTVGEIEERMLGLQAPYEQAIARADIWRQETIADLAAAGVAAETYGQQIQRIHGQMLADAYQEDLRRRTDWAAGVERGYADIQAAALDFASTAEQGLVDAARSAEDAWVRFVRTGKLELNDLLTTILDMAARLSYQQFLAPGINAGLNWLVSGLGGLLGGGGVVQGVAAAPMLVGQQGHTGMIAGVSGGERRTLPTSTWLGAPRLHLGSDEVPAILQRREGVFTPRQMDNADRLIQAIASRPVIVDLGRQGGAAARPHITIYGAREGARSEERQRDDGGWDIDIFLDQAEERIAGRVLRGASPLNGAIEQSYRVGRAV